MIKTQIQLPDELYHRAKAIAKEREWSLAEVVRRGLEHMARAYPLRASDQKWKLPVLPPDHFQADFDRLDFKALAEADEISSK
jgi:hypothetical protein